MRTASDPNPRAVTVRAPAVGAADLGGRPDLRILQAIRRIIRSVDLHSRRLSSLHGVTSPQLVCLKRLIESGPITAKDLAGRVHLSPSTLVGIIDRLEARGFVRRERSVKDRRQVFLHATDAGRDMAGRAPSPLQENLSRAMARLPEQEQADLAAAVERLVELMEIGGIDAAPLLDTAPHLAAEPDTDTKTKDRS